MFGEKVLPRIRVIELEAERDRIQRVLDLLEPLIADGDQTDEKKSDFSRRMSRQMKAYWRRRRNARK